MKILTLCVGVFGAMMSAIGYTQALDLDHYLKLAKQKELAEDITWKRLLYTEDSTQSEVAYSGYFLAENGRNNSELELKADITALFQQSEPNQSFRCKFPARSQWLIQQLNLSEKDLPNASCPEFEQWYSQIKPHKATLIYATDFMGNPSSMFGHTLLRLDPENQKQLNLVSYAVNYAATVNGEDSWSYAWKGLVGKYPGEYSLMPYYRKVKEYGDFESRDLWEYELKLSPEETQFLVKHMWEMQKVSFPYYFVSDNCAYRLLGLIDLVRPTSNLRRQFSYAAIPVETIKAIDQAGLIRETVYRPALETQLNAQATQHGHHRAAQAHQLAWLEPQKMAEELKLFSLSDQAKLLEMAYDDLYLQFLARKVSADFAQPRFRQLLSLRSSLNIEKQRVIPKAPTKNPLNGHDARHFSVEVGEVQGEKFIQLGHRQAYHTLKDPQSGFRTGTQLIFLDGALQWRDDQLKIEHLDLLSVNSYNPITPFKAPLSWGFNVGWQQEAVSHGVFSEDWQHGVFSLKAQSGYTYANDARTHLCYVQLQTQIQTGQALDKAWRVGLGPTVGCQNIWTDRINSVLQLELPYWQDVSQWNPRFNGTLQYSLNQQNAVQIGFEYQQQNDKDWIKGSLGLTHYF